MYYGKDKGESTRPVQDAFDFKMECCCKKKNVDKEHYKYHES